MKKLFAIALSVLMIVCAIVPALAATHTTKDGLTIESLVPNAELPEEFVEAGELAAIDFVDDNANLVAGTDYFTRDESHPYGGAGISVQRGVKYAIPFTVEEAGTYEFCVAHFVRSDDAKAGYPHASSVQIDDGDLYSVNEDDIDALVQGAINYYTGLSVELTAGEHTFYLVGDFQNGINAYFSDIYYYLVGDEDDAADDTSADAGEDTSADAGEDTSADAGEDTSADAGEDTSADAGNDDVAPETFDAAIIALAVAGASAAVAVVSKKRR